MSKSIKVIGIFTLAMINVAAIGTVKNWPVAAEYGLSSIFFLLLASLVFFIPISLVSAELATGWPTIGGIFAWVKEAFGHRTGFLAIWLLWTQNVIFLPTFLSFIAAAFAYVFDPDLASNTLYMASSVLILFWGTTLANLFGMKISGWISSFGVLFGTFIPGILIILFGAIWFFSDSPSQITFSLQAMWPDLTNIDQLVFFTGILLTLCGMEMSAVHARDVKDPQRDYPKAILLSTLIVLGLSILGVLSIAIVIPQSQITLVAGSLQAFSYFVEAYHLKWLAPYFAALIGLGAIGSMSTWMVGPAKGLLAAAQSGDLPPYFRKVNKKGMPSNLLIAQAILVTFLSLLFLKMPTVSSAYWILSVLTAQLYLVMYVIMFATAIKLRYSQPGIKRPYRVPGGMIGMWVTCALGTLSSIVAFVIGFLPPGQIATGNTLFYMGFLAVGIVLLCFGPALILLFQKPSWKKALSHEKNE
jgi:glutamate:GABA antiporter